MLNYLARCMLATPLYTPVGVALTHLLGTLSERRLAWFVTFVLHNPVLIFPLKSDVKSGEYVVHTVCCNGHCFCFDDALYLIPSLR